MADHVRVLGILYLINGIFTMLVSCCIAVLFFSLSAVTASDPDAEGIGAVALLIIGVSVVGLFLVLGVPDIIAGYGLLKLQSWSRILTLILAVFHVFSFPLGTALAVYSFWVLLQDETKELMESSRGAPGTTG